MYVATTSHPAWCDLRSCKAQLDDDGSVSYEHRSASPTMRPAAHGDADLTVRHSQFDDRSRFPWIGDVNVILTATDTSSMGSDGGHLEVVVDLDPMDARMLAAQLLVVAEQVEATRNAERGGR